MFKTKSSILMKKTLLPLFIRCNNHDNKNLNMWVSTSFECIVVLLHFLILNSHGILGELIIKILVGELKLFIIEHLYDIKMNVEKTPLKHFDLLEGGGRAPITWIILKLNVNFIRKASWWEIYMGKFSEICWPKMFVMKLC